MVWWSTEPDKVSSAAARAMDEADELAVSDITWFELAWLAQREKISLAIPSRSWLEGLEPLVRTFAITPAIATTAAALPSSFPGDPADRVIYATAIEHGCRLVTKDRKLRSHRHPKPITIW